MERLGSASNRDRRYEFVEQIQDLATMVTEEDQEDPLEESKHQPSVSINAINVDRLEADDEYMRFTEPSSTVRSTFVQSPSTAEGSIRSITNKTSSSRQSNNLDAQSQAQVLL